MVVGVDFSEGSAGALAVARDLASPGREPVHLVHVAVEGNPEGISPASREAWLGAAAVQPSDIEERSGLPWVELVRAAAECGAWLIAVGTHGRTGFQPLRLGTTATHLALRSRTPVVLVPPAPGAGNEGPNHGRRTMKHLKKLMIVGSMAAATLATTACGKKPAPAAPAPTTEAAPTDDAAARARREAEERARREAEARAAEEAARREAARKRSVLEEMVFFDYDDATIRSDAKASLDAKARILKEDGTIRVRVVGHADERGSTEYNVLLGMRRAQSIRSYLAGYGIAADRVELQSMGEERPLAPGHDERAWSRNRRGEFSVLAGMRAGG